MLVIEKRFVVKGARIKAQTKLKLNLRCAIWNYYLHRFQNKQPMTFDSCLWQTNQHLLGREMKFFLLTFVLSENAPNTKNLVKIENIFMSAMDWFFSNKSLHHKRLISIVYYLFIYLLIFLSVSFWYQKETSQF